MIGVSLVPGFVFGSMPDLSYKKEKKKKKKYFLRSKRLSIITPSLIGVNHGKTWRLNYSTSPEVSFQNESITICATEGAVPHMRLAN